MCIFLTQNREKIWTRENYHVYGIDFIKTT